MAGNFTYGLYAVGDNNTLTNNGTVTTSGVYASGLLAVGENNSVPNSGTVISQQSYSIGMPRANAILNLNLGSVLFGDVLFGDTGTATLNFGTGLNAVVRSLTMLLDRGYGVEEIIGLRYGYRF